MIYQVDLRLRFTQPFSYFFCMRLFYYFCLCITSSLGLTVAATAELIDAGEVTRQGAGRLAIAVTSSDASLAKLARRAFGLHGGCTVTPASKAAFTIEIERASESSVTLVISSAGQEQLRRTVPGSDLQNATLRACDMAVEATLHIPGFFAGKLAFVGKQRGIL